MTDAEAIGICESWFAHLERQRQKSVAVQKLAKLARTDPDGARRQLRAIDTASVVVFDGDRLELAVRHLIARATEVRAGSSDDRK